MMGMAEEFKADGMACQRPVAPHRHRHRRHPVRPDRRGRPQEHCRTVEIMADAAHAIFLKPSRSSPAQFVIDDTFLYGEGVPRLRPIPASTRPPPGCLIFSCRRGGGGWTASSPPGWRSGNPNLRSSWRMPGTRWNGGVVDAKGASPFQSQPPRPGIWVVGIRRMSEVI